MQPRRTTLWVACCVLGLSRMAAPAPAVAAEVDPAWFPLRAGSTWHYDTHRDRTFSPKGAAMNRGLHGGRTSLVAEPAPERGPGAFVVRETSVLQPSEGMAEKERSTAWTVYSFGKELRMHASSETRGDGSEGEVVYDPPLRILPTTTVGETWNAGTLRNGAQRSKVQGRVVGIEDLEGEPRWTGCLKVRLAGDISGTVGVADPPAEIASGSYERLLWFVRGVGIVRDVTTVTLDMRLPEDRVSTIDVLTLRLVEHRGPE